MHSPFPHQRFDGTGLETFRFNWATGEQEPLLCRPSRFFAPRAHAPNGASRNLSPATLCCTSADRLLRLDDSEALTAPADRQTVSHMHRQKSSLGVCNIERDWVHVGVPDQYVHEMLLREAMPAVGETAILLTSPFHRH